MIAPLKLRVDVDVRLAFPEMREDQIPFVNYYVAMYENHKLLRDHALAIKVCNHASSDSCPIEPSGPHVITEPMRLLANELMAEADASEKTGDRLKKQSCELSHLADEFWEASGEKRRRAAKLLFGR